jgi:thymidylate synthase
MAKLPQLVAEGDSLPEAWEKSLLLLYDKGINYFKESYKLGVAKDKILECSMKMVVRNPLKEPMLHMGCMGIETYKQYVSDVLEGTKDYMIGKGYDYTYHERLFHYKGMVEVDQVEKIVKKLSSAPYSNRAQAVTWQPWRDNELGGPPCLQRVWCKIFDDELELHTSWRSRDAFNAAFFNMLAMVHLQKKIADSLGVKVGQYVDDSDSYHVYYDVFPDFERCIKTIKLRIEQEAKGEKTRPRWVNSSFFDSFK